MCTLASVKRQLSYSSVDSWNRYARFGLITLTAEVYIGRQKSLQSLFKKLTDAGVLKNSELDEQRISLQQKTGDPANHKKFLEPMEALSAVS